MSHQPVVYDYSTSKFSFVSIAQGQALYTGNAMNKFYPIVYGEDISYADSDEDSAR